MDHIGLVLPDQIEQGAPATPIPALDDGVDGEARHGSSLRRGEYVNLAAQIVQGQADLLCIVTHAALHGWKLAGDE